MRKREINLYGEIDDTSVLACINSIQTAVKEEMDKLPERRSNIRLNIYTPGGSVDAMFSLCDVMMEINQSKELIKVNTHILRKAYSAGFPIWLCGFDRTLSHHASAMYHDISYACFGSKEHHIERIGYAEDMQAMFDKIILDNFKISAKELENIRKSRKDYFFNREELIKGLKVGYRRYLKK